MKNEVFLSNFFPLEDRGEGSIYTDGVVIEEVWTPHKKIEKKSFCFSYKPLFVPSSALDFALKPGYLTNYLGSRVLSGPMVENRVFGFG